MELNDTINLIMFLSVCVCLMMGFPVAFTLAGVALIFGSLGAVLGVFDLSFISAMPNRIFGNAMTNEILLAVPLFVFMGVMLERSKVAEQLLERWGNYLVICGADLAFLYQSWGHYWRHQRASLGQRL